MICYFAVCTPHPNANWEMNCAYNTSDFTILILGPQLSRHIPLVCCYFLRASKLTCILLEMIKKKT